MADAASLNEADSSSQHPPRKRARQACIACNARRVRCNVTEQRPCQNCVVANVACETRESRRGKHPRPSKRAKSEHDHHDGQAAGVATAGAGGGDGGGVFLSGGGVGGDSHRDDEVAVSHVLASLHKNRQSTGSAFDTTIGDDSVVEHYDEKTSNHEDLKEDEGAVFLGESSSLRYVHQSSKPPQVTPQTSIHLRHSVPSAVKAESLIPQWESERRRARIELLKTEGAFSLPPQPILEELLKTYFRDFHPCFAIVSEPDIWRQMQAGILSPLLLQAMLFVGVIHCNESILMDLGLDNRHKAKYIFYNRVKDIYDADFETKKLTVIQALFLMSFWRAGALLEKDARHWLGAAITLAESKALHRSTGHATHQTAKLRKRLWWSMYTRERQCAAALGLPNRVRDDDCDIEPLDRSDFEGAFSPAVEAEDAERFISYAIGMADLARWLGKIVLGEYLPNRALSPSQRSQMRDDLQRWKQRLPYEMQSDSDLASSGFYTNMLHLAYNNLLILLYRPGFIGAAGTSNGNTGNGAASSIDADTTTHPHQQQQQQQQQQQAPPSENTSSSATPNSDVDGSVALQAAARNSTIIENMLAEGNLRHAQIHVITNLFNTLCVHTVHMRRSDGTARAVAEHRAKLCLLGLKELQRTWEVKNWLLKLFFQYLDSSTAARLRVERDDDSALPTALASTRASVEPVEVEHSSHHHHLHHNHNHHGHGVPNANAPGMTSGHGPGVGMMQQQHGGAGMHPGGHPIASMGGEDMFPNALAAAVTPWSWTTEEANQFLFSQIENEFAFGEGGTLDWSPDDGSTVFNGNAFMNGAF